jgi:hypothetical protein
MYNECVTWITAMSQSPENPDEDLFPLVAALRASIDAQLQNGEESNMLDFDAIFYESFKKVAEPLIVERLRQLTAIDFANLYQRVLGNSAMTEQLESLQEMKAEELARTTHVEQLRHAARMNGKLELKDFEKDEALNIGLFDPTTPRLAAREHIYNAQARPLHRILSVRTLDPAAGYIEVLHDVWKGAPWAEQYRTPLVTPHSRGYLGSLVVGPDTADHLEPELSIHSPLAYEFGHDRPTAPPQIIGYVELHAGSVVMNGGGV